MSEPAWRVAWCFKRSLVETREDYLTAAEANARAAVLSDGTRDVVVYRIDIELGESA